MSFERISDPADPQRCQGSIKNRGQCINKAAKGSKNCMAHGGNHGYLKEERISLRNYRLTKYYARAQQLGESEEAKSLRDEIGIVRMILETKLNECHDDYDLLLSSSVISDLVTKIEKLVVSCNKLEGSMGEHLDKSAILQFASSVINIISSEIDDKKIVNKIADRIMEEMSDESNK